MGGKAYTLNTQAYQALGKKATVATYNNRTTWGSVPDASGGPPRYRTSQPYLTTKPLLLVRGLFSSTRKLLHVLASTTEKSTN